MKIFFFVWLISFVEYFPFKQSWKSDCFVWNIPLNNAVSIQLKLHQTGKKGNWCYLPSVRFCNPIHRIDGIFDLNVFRWPDNKIQYVTLITDLYRNKFHRRKTTTRNNNKKKTPVSNSNRLETIMWINKHKISFKILIFYWHYSNYLFVAHEKKILYTLLKKSITKVNRIICFFIKIMFLGDAGWILI